MKQIMEHVKMLKAQIYVPKAEPIDLEEEFSSEDHVTLTQDEKESFLLDPKLGATKSKTEKPKIINDSEFKNIPKGFKEIEASKDFKIIAPHDEEFVNKILNMDVDRHVEQESPPKKSDDIITPFEPSKDGDSEFCFACGAEVSPNQEKCPSCGTNLK